MFVVDFYNDTWRTSMASFENSYMLFDDKKGIIVVDLINYQNTDLLACL